MPVLSIIVPVFNSEKYLGRCLDSICAQTFSDFELICVDDASSDGSLRVLRQYASRDSRVRIVELPSNCGPSSARNAGLELARGEYVGFVDSDDWIDPGYFEAMVCAATGSDADVVVNPHLPFYRFRHQPMEISGEFCADELPVNIFCRIFRRSMIVANGVAFPQDCRCFEDEFFVRCMCVYSSRIVAISSEASYHYVEREDSVSHKSPFTRSGDCLKMFRALFGRFGHDEAFLRSGIKLWNRFLFTEISSRSEFEDVKAYVGEISDTLERSNMFVTDFDRLCFDALRCSDSLPKYLELAGKDPLTRYQTIERLKRRKGVRVSVVVPLYNTESYIVRCLRSISSQSLREIEIVVVDDCSTDNSLLLSRICALGDNRMRIISLSRNSGVSTARNTGMDQAAGEYLYFMDSDDWIDGTRLEELYSTACQKEADIVVNTLYINEFDDRSRNQVSDFPAFDAAGSFVESSVVQRTFPPVVWARLYRRSFVLEHGVRYPIVAGGAEDIFFTAACELNLDKVYVFTGKAACHYYQRQDSAMHKSSRGFHYIESFSMLHDFLCFRGISLKGVKLYYVESLVLDAQEKFDFTRKYLLSICGEVAKNEDIYNEQDKFLMRIVSECVNYGEFRAKYNPNIALSFVRSRMIGRR